VTLADNQANVALATGDKEMESRMSAGRDRGAKSARVISKNDFINEVIAKIASRNRFAF